MRFRRVRATGHRFMRGEEGGEEGEEGEGGGEGGGAQKAWSMVV
jgi:hypothetical protein